MSTPFRTPLRPKGNDGALIVVQMGSKVKAVDLVTGKAKVEYFFDPSLVIPDDRADTPFKSGRDGNSSTPYRKDLSMAFEADGDPLMTGSKHLFMPCTIIKPLDATDDNVIGEPIAAPTLVKTSDGTLHKIRDSSKLVKLTSPDDYMGVSDVLHLPHVTEASLLHTLRLRYRRDEIYTSAGPILLSINPYKMVAFPNGESLYSEQVMMQYRNKANFEEELAPHLFQVADRAYSALLASVYPGDLHIDEEDAAYHTTAGTVRNQSIIISGESGAGKTEATKYIMQYLARITKRPDASSEIRSPDGKLIAALEDRVLSSNPLLESFGNARTLRNDNSSRFGKFIHIYFSTDTGTITGASISNYLLEKTRITQQTEGERNYHIFYQLLAGAGDDILTELGLNEGPSGFQYLGMRDAQKSRRDANGFVETKECLTQIGLSYEDQRVVFSIVAAVLHLGNIEFEEKGDNADEDKHSETNTAKISEATSPCLVKACDLLGLDEEKVSEAILSKLLTVGGKTIHKNQSAAQAAEKRDAFAKLTYSCLFLWLVHRVNQTFKKESDDMVDDDSHDYKIQDGSKHTGFIGVLDIYGFEVFEVNGYEQLLINYCNEKLQRHFNRHLFEVEQDLYASEGVDWTYITFNDNRPCLELIEGGGGAVGILNALDDAWGAMCTASEKDVKFVSHLNKLFGSESKSAKKKKKGRTSHLHYVQPKFGNDRQFIIVHYAGDVRYTANGFVEKNMETLSNELKDLGAESTVPMSKQIYSCGSNNDEDEEFRRSSLRGVSVASQFKASLQSLIADLEQTQPHYIRCIKPNLGKAANSLDSGEVLRQLRYSGMMEAIRIRREGYALREGHESFYNRFSVLLNPEDLGEEAGIEQLVKVLSKRLAVSDVDWQIGHSKIFLRRELATKLERLSALKVHAAARIVSRFGRFVAERRAVSALTAWGRFRLHLIAKHRRDRAVTTIIATYRGSKQMKQFSAMREVVLTLQAHQRRKAATEIVRMLRDPYSHLTFKEMKKLQKMELARLDEAVKQKDFKAATEIEKLLKEIATAMESKRPRTRSLLESEIADVQKDLDDALERKAYDECAPLQEKLEILVAQRCHLPTIEELREKLEEVEREVAAAAERRDFASAAAGQARIDEAKRRLEEAIFAEAIDDDESHQEDAADPADSTQVHEFTCRAELEVAISDFNEKIKNAIQTKDFTGASAFQVTLDEMELLKQHFPTVGELEALYAGAKHRLDEVVSNRDYAAASKLHEEIDVLEKKLALEKDRAAAFGTTCKNSETEKSTACLTKTSGEEVVFTSRVELEAEISDNIKRVTEAVASKEFKKAEELQSFVDALESLRTKLPSISELESKLKQKELAMDAAIKEKKFSTAEEIHLHIEKLEASLELERSKSPATDPVTLVGRAISGGASLRTASSGVVPKVMVVKPPTSVTAQPRLDTRDDISEISISSGLGQNKHTNGTTRSSKTSLIALDESTSERPVSKLRPKKPLISSADDSILTMTQMLSNKRGDAALVVNASGGLAGIITDTDITRRVVAKDVDPASSSVSMAMTPNPTCVSMTDSAMDALGTMVENHFRHLPVVDDSGAVVGLLDIAKCLNDAISKLERAKDKGSSAAEDALKQVAGLQGAGGAQAAALQALLGPLMAQAFGNQASPSLRSLLAGTPATVVRPTTSVRDAGILMAERRKAALVVEDDRLVGIFGFKDMMTRAVAKQLPLDLTDVRSVMTPNPESVSPDMTVLEALETMHDNKFLTLPVCESDGRVVGLVDVMDVIYGCGGAEGWRSVFSSAMELDDASDTSSVLSHVDGSRAMRSTRTARSAKKKEEERPVSRLRPKKPLISSADDSILTMTQMLSNKRGDAALVVNASGGLAGIITDTDITRRVVAKDVDPASSSVSMAMTPNPTCVSMTDSAMDALGTMVENHFRHLPVVDDSGAVVGLLDIAKCLNDAISKLERAKDKGSSAAEDALKQVAGLQGAGGAQAAALQALLGPLMAQAFGNQASPSLRSLLAGTPATVVRPTTSVRDAGILMAERRKAALVVEDDRLVGIFGFKDMMTRAVAKQLPLDLTDVRSVMTPNPESVSPDMTVLEALETMHDNKFLTLPVCESDGRVVGLVDVMDVIYGCGGAEGWRSVFSSAMELDDASDTSSVLSHGDGSRAMRSTRSARSTKKKEDRPVSRLRPKKPLISSADDSILTMTQMLSNKRGDAALVVNASGGLAGIITDTDITRRVVAKDVDPASSSVSMAMTPNPTCVSMTDSAMDALGTMVENHFRHLPVVDDSGAVVGLLDIAKCLNDAISKLERAKDKGSSAAEDALKQVAGLQGAGGAQAAALQALLGPLMAQAFGNQASPSLRSLLAGTPATVVRPTTSVRDAGILMAERRKAALVVEDDRLVGIFGFKDMMTRAVAKQLPLDLTDVRSVMTPNPESVSPDMTVLEALQTMHDNKFLTLPVCESDGRVVGLVDVMDVIYGCGGAEGWRSVFSSAMELDDASDTSSVLSHGDGSRAMRSTRSARSTKKKEDRPVSRLRPKKPLISSADDSILTMTQMLSNKRGDAALVVNASGGLAGIITDTDITRRVVAKDVDPASSSVSMAMTPNPTCVSMTDSAMDALGTMVENHFRHLPVVDDSGAVVGLLDIAKCLNDAISKLERAKDKGSSAAEDALKQVAGLQGAGGAQAAALQALLGPLMAQAFGNQASPSLRSLLAGTPATVVRPTTSVRDAGILMAERRKAALVVEDDRLVGIFGFKDMMTRAVAKQLPLDLTDVRSVMTPNPESVSPDMTVLEALQTMHDNKFLTLPVCESDGRVVGLVDVMDVIYGCGGAEGWRSVFSSAMELDDDASDMHSNTMSTVKAGAIERAPVITVSPDAPFVSDVPSSIPTHVEIDDGAPSDHGSLNESLITDTRGFASTAGSPSYGSHGFGAAVFKLTDPSGHTHRIRSELKVSTLLDLLVAKMGDGVDAESIRMKFVDDEGDAVMITSNECLAEAFQLAQKSGNEVVKLTVTIVKPKTSPMNDISPLILAGVGAVIAIGAIALLALRPRSA